MSVSLSHLYGAISAKKTGIAFAFVAYLVVVQYTWHTCRIRKAWIF